MGYEITNVFLDKNSYSRPGSTMKGIRGIGIHWVGNAKSTAIANRNYFNNLPNINRTEIANAKKEGRRPVSRHASSHEIIGLNGEIIVCMPPNEVAFHVGAKSYKPRVRQLLENSPNRYLYGIETCHPDWNGKFNDKTYNTLIKRSADLLIQFNLSPSKDTIWRHYDVTGKDCPRYYVNNNSEWNKLIDDITREYNKKINGKIEEEIIMKLEQWQKDMGEKSIRSLSEKGIINNPELWEKSIAESTPQYLFWSIIDRVLKANE